MDDDEEREAAEVALEEAFARYMRAKTENADTLVLEGYLFYAVGRTMENLDKRETSHVWGHQDGQPVHVTLGLARLLDLTVRDWFINGEPRVQEED